MKSNSNFRIVQFVNVITKLDAKCQGIHKMNRFTGHAKSIKFIAANSRLL